MAGSRNIKADARRIVDELPDNATWEDLMYEIYVRESIETGLEDAEAGRVVSNEDALSRIRAGIRRGQKFQRVLKKVRSQGRPPIEGDEL